jgi:hypothetical protein
MTETQQKSSQQGQQDQGSVSRSPQDQQFQGQFSQGQQSFGQPMWDQSTFSQMPGGQTGQYDQYAQQATQQIVQSYWELAQQTLHQAQRVHEIQALNMIRQQIVTEASYRAVAQAVPQVISELQRNPSLLKSLLQQSPQS